MAILARSENKLTFRGINNMPTLSKSTKVFFNVQAQQHSLNEAPSMVGDRVFSTVKLKAPHWEDSFVGWAMELAISTKSSSYMLHRYNTPQIFFSIEV